MAGVIGIAISRRADTVIAAANRCGSRVAYSPCVTRQVGRRVAAFCSFNKPHAETINDRKTAHTEAG
jgi:hypothetical protein